MVLKQQPLRERERPFVPHSCLRDGQLVSVISPHDAFGAFAVAEADLLATSGQFARYGLL
jgi:hypothetical protein